MDPMTFDTLVRQLSSAPSRRAVLGGLAGTLAAVLGREPARAQVCVALPCKNAPGRCGGMGSSCVCCRGPGGATQCLYRAICRASGGTIVPSCGGVNASCAPETEVTDCCSGECTIPWGCCPVCPPGCSCVPIRGGPVSTALACTDRGGSHQLCGCSECAPCPTGEECFEDAKACFTTCAPVT
jgi:hypothetical protein